MSMIVNILINDLRSLITDLGKSGGLMSPSIYDTAQILRIYPGEDRVWSAVNWLLAQQQPDGGWGDPFMPLSRAVPTLASILALRSHCERRTTVDALESAKTFLRRQLSFWTKPLPDDLPVGMELLWPYMLEEAVKEEAYDEQLQIPVKVKLGISPTPYRELVALGDHKRAKIRAYQPGKGTTPAFSWEAWGTDANPDILDASGGVGHSPTATAAWLRKATENPRMAFDLAPEIEHAQQYLRDAAFATSESTPGIFPTAWPITRFEQSFSLYALVVGELLNLPAIQDVLNPQIADLQASLTPKGIGFSDNFMADGDDTAAAVAVLLAADKAVDLNILRQFEAEHFFVAYAGEAQPSLSLTARAVHALDLAGEDISRWWETFISSQQLDGTWSGDKWNTSWLYTTCHVMIALKNSPHKAELRDAVQALKVNQFPDGGWGMIQRSTTVETAYAVLALHSLQNTDLLDESDRQMLRRGYKWLLEHYRPFRMKEYKCWLNKEIYCPQRIDRAYELSALLAVTLGDLQA